MKKSDLNTFNDITDQYLQAYNRLSVVFNLNTEKRVEEAKSYLSQFTARERVVIGIVTADIKKRGFTVIKKEIQAKLAKLSTLVDSLEDEGLEGTAV